MSDRCEHIQSLLPAYALNALSAEERWQVEEHVAVCPDCREQLDGYLSVAELLLSAVPAVEPPAGLRARLIAAIGEPRAASRPRKARLFSGWRALAAGLLSLLVIANALLFIQTRNLTRQQAQLGQQLAEDQVALGLAAYPSARAALVRGDGTYGTFLFEPDLPLSILYAWGLEPLAQDQTYQAWLIEPDGDRVDGGIFRVEQGTGFVHILIRAPQDLSAYVGVGVTIEPKGGSPAPTGPRVLGADL
jgi:anti-sigma-K factor RskA